MTVVACCITPGIKEEINIVSRSFSTITAGLAAQSKHSAVSFWIVQENIGSLYTTCWNQALKFWLSMILGRKTDVLDAQWIAELLRHGLLRGSFIPPLPQRDLRDLTRQRTNLVQERAAVVNRLQKTLEWVNINSPV